MQPLSGTCKISCGQSIDPGHNCYSDFFYAPAITLRLHIKITEVELFLYLYSLSVPTGGQLNLLVVWDIIPCTEAEINWHVSVLCVQRKKIYLVLEIDLGATSYFF